MTRSPTTTPPARRGGIDNSATLVVSDSTLSGNTAATASSGGGIDNTGSGTVALANSVLSGNSANSAADDFDGAAYTDNGGNVAGVVNGTTVNATAINLAPLAKLRWTGANPRSAARQPGHLRRPCRQYSFGPDHGRARSAQHQHQLSKLLNLRRCRRGADELCPQLLYAARRGRSGRRLRRGRNARRERQSFCAFGHHPAHADWRGRLEWRFRCDLERHCQLHASGRHGRNGRHSVGEPHPERRGHVRPSPFPPPAAASLLARPRRR